MLKDIKYIAKLSLPLMFAFFITMLFGLVDTIYAGVIGENAITSISYFIPMEFIFMAIYVGAQVAFTVYFSRALGANNMDDLKQYYAAAKHVLKYLFIGMIAIFFIFLAITYFLPLSKEIITGIRQYSLIRIAGMTLFMVPLTLLDSVLRSHKKMNQSMNTQVIGNIVNIILNTIFVFVFHWGVFGLGFATFLSRGVAMITAYGYTKQFSDFRYILKSKTEKSASSD